MKQHPMISVWNEMLWNAMAATGKGYMKHSMKRTGKGEDRRGDKFDGLNKHARSYGKRRGVDRK